MVRLEDGNILRLICTDVDPEKDEEFGQWYDTEHEPLLNSVNGVLQNYKGLNLTGRKQKYFFLYVHRTANIQNSEEYRAVSQTEWSKKVRPFIKNFEVESYKAIPGGQIPRDLREGNVLRTVHFGLTPDSEAQFQKWFDKVYMPVATKISGLMAVCRATNLQDKGLKHLIVYFLEDLAVVDRLSFEFASRKGENIYAMMPQEAEWQGMNYGLQKQLAG
jgi:hypothetical protein